jgi:hypothetical protein
MNPRHPLSILLLLLLAASVFASGFSMYDAAGTFGPALEQEDGREEACEDAREDAVDFVDIVEGLVFREQAVEPRAAIVQRLSDRCQAFPSLRSFGWMLPLRL